jgi:hypothetical protein
MSRELDVQRLVNVQVSLSAKVKEAKDFGTLLVIGDSNVITGKRTQSFSSVEELGQAFGQDAPEYKAGLIYFSQNPQPTKLLVGRWFNDTENASLLGGTAPSLTALKLIDDGDFDISIDGTVQQVRGLDLTVETNLNGVATKIQDALTGVQVLYDGSKFIIKSLSLSQNAGVGYATYTAGVGAGTDLATPLRLIEGVAQIVPVTLPEYPVDALKAIIDETRGFYSIMYASDSLITDDELFDVGQLVAGLTDKKLLLATSNDPKALLANDETDLGSRFKAVNNDRVIMLYDANDSFAVAGIAGIYGTVNYDARQSTITVMYKVPKGIAAEELSSSEADVLQAKNYNVFARYKGDVAIIQYGTVASGRFIDTIVGFDWLASTIQDNIFNLLLTSKKVPMTNSGMQQISAEIARACEKAVYNGLLNGDGGTWNLPDIFGVIRKGQVLPKGYLIDYPNLSTLSDSDRQKRKSVPFTVYVIEAGAVHVVPLVQVEVSN